MTYRWSLAMTTAPRTPSTLQASIVSVLNAGWDRDELTLIAEPGTEIPAEFQSLRTSVGLAQKGPYPAFRRALATLLEFAGNPAPDLLVVFQDDIEVTRGLRRSLDRCKDFASIQDDYAEVVSLYSARPNDQAHLPGWDILAGKGPQRNGALALVMTPSLAAQFLRETRDDPIDSRGLGTDYRLARWLAKNDMEYWTHWPSFVRHTGLVSSLSEHGGTVEGRQCGEWLPEIGAPPVKIPVGE